MTVTIIIPTYNERDNIIALLQQLRQVNKQWELLIVDDSSADGTGELVQSFASHHQGVRLIQRRERGLSSAIVRGFREARGSHLVVMDADLSHDPAVIPQLLQPLKEGHDLVVASRRVPGGGADHWPFHRQLTSAIATHIAQRLLPVRLHDPMSGFFAVKRSVVTAALPRLTAQGYKILLELMVKNPGVRLKEVPFVFKDRRQGHSKLSPRVILQYVSMVMGLRRL